MVPSSAMTCHNCARRTLTLFVQSLTSTVPAIAPRRTIQTSFQQSRRITVSSSHRRPQPEEDKIITPDLDKEVKRDGAAKARERPAWAIQKQALREKLGGEAWNPRKKLSPDTMEGIRHLHNTQPDRFTTPVLAQYFKVSPEAIRRILKSKWRPTDEEAEARMERWDRRGERIWSNLVELGVKPPKVWRQMGVGSAKNGEKPKWKGRRKLMADVRDSAANDFVVEEGDIIPTVDASGRSRRVENKPLAQRL